MLWGALIIFLGFFCFVGGVILLVGKLIDEHIVFRIGKGILMFFGIPLLLVTTLLSLAIFSGWNHIRVPANNFRDVFECSPPPDVTSLQSDVSGYFDCNSVFLKFRVPAATFTRLSANTWRQVKSAGEGKEALSTLHDSKPAWWNPAIATHTVAYVPVKKAGSFSSEKTILIYDHSSQTAYFGYLGID